jgi:hypothetical protein
MGQIQSSAKPQQQILQLKAPFVCVGQFRLE